MKAFPRADGKYNSSVPDEKGMDLRDYFAAKAMQGMISSVAAISTNDIKHVCESAYVLADAMMKARETTTPPITRDFKVDEELRGQG